MFHFQIIFISKHNRTERNCLDSSLHSRGVLDQLYFKRTPLKPKYPYIHTVVSEEFYQLDFKRPSSNPQGVCSLAYSTKRRHPQNSKNPGNPVYPFSKTKLIGTQHP